MTHALPEALLWDLDGTLVDSEPLWIAAEHELVAAHGGVWTDEDALSLVGNSLDDSALILIERGVDLTPQQVIDNLVDRVNTAMTTVGPDWRPGARELVAQAAAAGVPQAIVTMSYRVQAEAVAGLLPPGAITTIVAGDMVTHGKPHPEAYLTAAATLGVDVTRCIAVEDSATGSASARASGARTVVVPHAVEVPHAPGLARTETLEGLTLADLVTLSGLGAPDPA
ncbi:HAD family hydrolase [Serinibacter arcticus]|uniref:HAD family hydrolase n=1 Tax=Serinibacter arcticus TaxID=1655435 RepID=UPI001F22034D|nr:HAD family phosphatase [Serinibacter arcticus]